MSDEHTKNGDARGGGTVTSIGERADRYGIVNLGNEIKATGECLSRVGILAGKVTGTGTAAYLLDVERLLSEHEANSFAIRALLREYARAAVARAVSETP